MHAISIPYKITKGEDVITRKRLGFSACVRNMYRNLAKGELSQKEVIDIAKNKYKMHYGLEEYIFNSAFVEAGTKVKQENTFDQKIEKRRQDRISENNKRTKIRNDARKEIRDIYKKDSISDSDLKNISFLKDKIKKNKKLNDLKKPKAGRIVFGGKNNLIAHQKRQEKLNKERLDILSNKELSNDEIIDKLNDIDNQLKENKNKWKNNKRLVIKQNSERRLKFVWF